MKNRLWRVFAATLIGTTGLACDPSPGAPPPEAQPPEKKAAPQIPATPPQTSQPESEDNDSWGGLDDLDEPEPIIAGPAGSGANKAERRAAVLAVLGGGQTAQRLPLQSADNRTAAEFGPPPTLKLGTPKVTGGALDVESIEKWASRWSRRATFCYDNALSTYGELEGLVVIKFDVGADGRIRNPTTKDGPLPKLFTECLADLVPSSFSAPGGGDIARIELPLEITPPAAEPSK